MEQSETAAQLGVTTNTLLNWELGHNVPTRRDGPAIVRLLGYNPLPKLTLMQQMYALRFERGWSQADAGHACGFSEDTWCNAESKGRATPMTRAKLVAAFAKYQFRIGDGD